MELVSHMYPKGWHSGFRGYLPVESLTVRWREACLQGLPWCSSWPYVLADRGPLHTLARKLSRGPCERYG